jgi:hypothetical protein
MKKHFLSLTLAVLLFFGSSNIFAFATLTAPSGGDPIVFNINVNNVDVFLNGVKVGRKKGIGFRLLVPRDGQEKIVTFKKAGYMEETIRLTTATTLMFWGNIITGGTLGSSTDSIFTKNSMEYSPNMYFIDMQKS